MRCSLRMAGPVALGGALLLAGCGGRPVATSDAAAASPAPGPRPDVKDAPRALPSAARADDDLPTISLSGAGAQPPSLQPPPAAASLSRDDVIAALQPFQTLLGTWRGTTRREIGDFKAIDESQWVWDLRSNRERPALVMSSANGAYLRQARLAPLSREGRFQLSAIDAAGRDRVFEGEFVEPVEEFQGAGAKTQRKYKLSLDEVGPPDGERWRIILNQQNNDRYLLELSRSRGTDFTRFDTVGHQREGTSFALNDSDYGARKCIISGGLGTIQVSYQGKSYWVCCTGCQAAFNEDPEGWLRDARRKEQAAP